MLDDTLKTYALVGEDDASSIFYSVQNSVFDALAENACYLPFSVKAEDLKSSSELLRESFSGFNVAAPYQYAMVKYMDELDETAEATGAVNAVKCAGGRLLGYNTLPGAFLQSMEGENINFYDKDVLVMNTGAAAKSIAYALIGMGAFITIVSRDFERSTSLREDLIRHCNKNRVRAIKGVLPSESFFAIFSAASNEMESRFADTALLDDTLKEAVYIYDTASVSGLGKKAAELGVRYKNGRDLFFFAALLSQKIWLGGETYGKLDQPAIEKIKAGLEKS